VQALRAGSTQVRAVTVTDAIEGGPAWSTTYSGIFASASDDYRLEVLPGNQWWSGLSPVSESDYYSYRSEEISTRRIYCHQQDGNSLPYSLPISIWSMQCLLTERALDQAPFSAEVTASGDKITVDINNRSTGKIREAWVVHWGRSAWLGEGPAKGQARLEGFLREGEPSHVSRSYALLGHACASPGSGQRTRAVDAFVKRGAAVVYAVYEDSPCCCRVAGATHSTTHTELVRLVVFPKKGGTP